MKNILFFLIIILWSKNVFAWKYATGKVEVLYVNTYGNYSEKYLNQGFCFKLEGFDHFLKIKYFETGEQENNLQFSQSIVLAAKMTEKTLKVTYVDWGDDTSCRVNGGSQAAKWLENIQIL